jgi:hypothetical protein
MLRLRPACCLAALLLSSGCLTPWNTRFPRLLPTMPQYERRQAEVQDPYPDKSLGPDTGFRPLEFDQQRSEERQAKDKHQATILRQQYGQPPTGASSAPFYPEAVRQ